MENCYTFVKERKEKKEKRKRREEAVLLSRREYREVRAIFRECVFTVVKLRRLGTIAKVQSKRSCRLCEL